MQVSFKKICININDSILLSSYFLTIFLPEIFSFSFFINTVPVISTSLQEQLVAKSMTQKKSTHRLTTVYFAKNDLETMKARSMFLSLKFDTFTFTIFSSLLPCWTSEGLGDQDSQDYLPFLKTRTSLTFQPSEPPRFPRHPGYPRHPRYSRHLEHPELP